MEYDCILWDWNGTIVDDCGIGFAAFCDVLRAHGKAAPSIGFYREHITTPIIPLYELFFDLRQTPFSVLDEEFNRNYAARAEGLSLTDGIPQLLALMQRRGIRQAILTSSWAHIVEKFAQQLRVAEYFDGVLGARAITEGSKIDRARAYLEQNRLAPSRCAVIGDTAHDHEVADALGMRCVLFGRGHQAREVLEQRGVPVVDSLADIPGVLGI